MTEQVDLDALYHVTDVADFLGESIKMSPAQFRTILHEMTASRAVEAAVAEQVETLRELIAKITAEQGAARAELARIVDEFGDYDGLEQSRAICDDRIAKLRAARARVDVLEKTVAQGIEAFRLTKEYVNIPDEHGSVLLPDVEGWSHFDWTERAKAVLEDEAP